MNRLSLCTAVALALGASSAQALVITDSFNNPLQTTEINQTGQLDKFDANLGVLNSVMLTIGGASQTTITLTNSAAQAQTVRATGTVDLLYSTTLGGLDLSSILFSLSMTTGLVTIQPNSTESFGPLSDTDSVLLNPAPALFSMAGGGTFNISCQSLSGISIVGGGGNVDSTQDTSAGCSAEIAYDFTPRQTTVPEPGSVALLGLGLAGLVALRRRRT